MIKKIFSRPITILTLTITIIIFGLISLFKLPVTLMPSGAGNVMAIITRYHGVSPEQIEKIVTVPLENSIGSIEGIKQVYSISEDGESKIYIYFHPEKDIESAGLKIREAVDKAAPSFPRACEKPYVIKNDPDDKSIFIFNIKSENMDINDLRFYAEHTLKKELSKIDGISEINFSGGSIKEIHIDVDPAKLISYGIDITSISGLVQNAYFVNSQGKIKEYNLDTTLFTDARFTSLQEIKLLPIHFDKDRGEPILLKDIADVYEGSREQENISRLNGNERVSVYIKKSGGSNTLEVCSSITKFVETKFAGNIKCEIIYNQSDYIKRAINNVRNAALIGGLIAVIVLIMFIRNIKAIILIAFSIPFSVVLTFFLMFIFKVEINIMTLSGFAIGIGMLLDNGVVMIQCLSEDMRRGVWDMSERIITPIITSTLTTVAIFFPITFLNYEFRRLYGGLALTVTFSLVSSVLCALVIIPAGYAIFNKFKKTSDVHHTKMSILLEKFTMTGLKFLWKMAYVIIGGIILLIIITPIIVLKIDKEYIDPAKGNEITAFVELEAGTSLKETERIVRKVEKLFMSEDSITRVNARIQKWHADIDIKYDSKKFKNQEKFIKYLKEKTDGFKDCFAHYEEKEQSEGSVINIDIIGDNDQEIREIAKQAAQKLGEIKELRTVLRFKEGKPSLTWVIDRKKCQEFQVPINSAGEQLRWAIYGPVALKYIKNNKEMDLRITFSDEYKKSLVDYKEMLVFNANGQEIYIKELGTFLPNIEPGKIYRKNKRKSVKVGVYLGEISLSKAIPKIKKSLESIELKDGYYFDFGDTLEKLKESQIVAMFALFLSIFMIFSILSIQFESFIIPLKIIPIIPVSACFSILILFVLKMSLNLSVYIGLIVLGGVVVNNTILITEGLTNSSVINTFTLYRVIKTRIKPVFVTTATTVLAMLPMIFQFGEGSELWRPLAITLTCGLVFGTFINLSVYPMLYSRNSSLKFLKNKIINKK